MVPYPKVEDVIFTCVEDNIVGKSRTTNQLDYMAFIIKFSKKEEGGEGLRGNCWVSIFEAYN